MVNYGYVSCHCGHCKQEMQVTNSHGVENITGLYVVCKNMRCGVFAKIFHRPKIELEESK